jgi:predicted nucleotidyltransferase
VENFVIVSVHLCRDKMSRRASFFARTHPGIHRVRFLDEIVFEEADGEVIISMLRRASLDIGINMINMAGMTALHQVRERLKVATVVHEKGENVAIVVDEKGENVATVVHENEENVARVSDEDEREMTKQIFSSDRTQF